MQCLTLTSCRQERRFPHRTRGPVWSGLLLPSAGKFPGQGRAVSSEREHFSAPLVLGVPPRAGCPLLQPGSPLPPCLSAQPAPRGLCCGQPPGVGPALGTSPVNVRRKGVTRGLSGRGAGSRHSSGAVARNEGPALPGGAGTELRAEGQSRLRDSGLRWGWLALRPGPTPAVGLFGVGEPPRLGALGCCCRGSRRGGPGLASPHGVSAGRRSAHRSFSVLSLDRCKDQGHREGARVTQSAGREAWSRRR